MSEIDSEDTQKSESYTITNGDTFTVDHIEVDSIAFTKATTGKHTAPSPSYYSVSSGLMGAILLFVVVRIWWKTEASGFSRIKKSGRRVLSFVAFVFHKKTFELLLGFLGQFIFAGLFFLDVKGYYKIENILHVELDHFIVYYCIYSLVFLGLWATPVMENLFSNFDSMNREHFNRGLTKKITGLNRHYVIFGYGQLGKSIVKNFIENYSFTDNVNSERKPLLLLRQFYNEKYEDVMFCNNLVIVDKDESLISNVYDHPTFGKIGVVILTELNCLRRHGYENYKKIYIPAIVGNVKKSAIISLSRLDKSKMVLSFVSDESSTSHLFDTIVKDNEQKQKKALISIPSTNMEYYLTPKIHDTNISFLHNFRTRGWTLGNVVSACILGKIKSQIESQIESKDDIEYTDNIRMLILGQGLQLHFLLEKIWFEVLWQRKRNSTLITVDEIYNWETLLREIKDDTKRINQLMSNGGKHDLSKLLKTADAEDLKDKIVDLFNNIKHDLTFYNEKVANQNILPWTEKQVRYDEVNDKLEENRLEKVYELKESEELEIITANLSDEQKVKLPEHKVKEEILSVSQKNDIHRFNIAILQELFPQFLSKHNSMNFFKDNCLIVGNDEYINNATISLDHKTYWQHELAHIATTVYKESNYTMQIPYLKGIPHDPSLLGPLVYGLKGKESLAKKTGAMQDDKKLENEEPFKPINSKFFEKKPDIIVITSDSHEDVNRTLYELNNIIKKYDIKDKKDQKEKPSIIVESNLLIQDMAMQLNKQIIGKQIIGEKDPINYPIPFLNQPFSSDFSETIVNSFSEGNKTVFGYIEAMSAEDGVTIRACIEDKPGGLAKLSFLLANLEFCYPSITKNNIRNWNKLLEIYEQGSLLHRMWMNAQRLLDCVFPKWGMNHGTQGGTTDLAKKLLTSKLKDANQFEKFITTKKKKDIVAALNDIKDNLTSNKYKVIGEPGITLSSETQKEFSNLKEIGILNESGKLKKEVHHLLVSDKESIECFKIAVLKDIFPQTFLESFKFVPNKPYNFKEGVSHIPSFHNTQALTLENNYFSFTSDADLIAFKGTTEEEKIKEVINIKSTPKHIREVFVSSNKPEFKKQIVGEDGLINNSCDGKPYCDGCIGMVFCPIYSNRNGIRAEPKESMIKKERNGARWRSDDSHKIKIIPNNRYSDYARIDASCTGTKARGLFAMLYYTLMLGKQDPEVRDERDALSIRYITNSECYNPGFTFVNIYGNIKKHEEFEEFEDSQETSYKKQILNGIVISPILPVNKWANYSKKLLEVLTEKFGKKYNLFYPKSEDFEKGCSSLLILSDNCKKALLKEYYLLCIDKIHEIAVKLAVKLFEEEDESNGRTSKQQEEELKQKLLKDFRCFLNEDFKERIEVCIGIVAEAIIQKSEGKIKRFRKRIEVENRLRPIPDSPFKKKALKLLTNGEMFNNDGKQPIV